MGRRKRLSELLDLFSAPMVVLVCVCVCVCGGVKGCVGGGGIKEVNVFCDCMNPFVSVLAGAVGDLSVR